jgi:hypothetical protein
MRLRLGWLEGLQQALFGPARLEARGKPMVMGIGYCPGCSQLRASSSLCCEDCGSTVQVTADA